MNSIGWCYQNSTCATAIRVKNRQKTVSIEEKLDVIRQLEKGRSVDICYYVRFICISVCKIHDIADRIKESAKSGTNVFM